MSENASDEFGITMNGRGSNRLRGLVSLVLAAVASSPVDLTRYVITVRRRETGETVGSIDVTGADAAPFLDHMRAKASSLGADEFLATFFPN